MTQHLTAPPSDQGNLILDVDDRGQYVLTAHDGLGGSQRVVLTDGLVKDLQERAAALIAQDAERHHPSMEVHVTAHRWANMGDHAVQAQHALPYDPTETVEALVVRALELQTIYGRHDPMDFLTLRVVEGTEPERPKMGGLGF